MNSIAHHTEGAKHVPAVDLRPTGHLPFAVQAAEQPRPRADQLDAGAREHREPLTPGQLSGLECARPGCPCGGNDLAYAGSETDIEVDGHHLLACAPAPLTADQRGPAWRARYGCTPWCVMDHAGDDGVPGWCSGPTAQVTAPTTSADHTPGHEPLTVLAARVVQCNDNPEAFGIKTQIWFEADTELYELDVTQARAMVARLKAFVPQMEALCEQLERAAVDDRPGDPEAQARYMAALDARIKAADTAESRG